MKATKYCIRFGHSLWSVNQLPARGVKIPNVPKIPKTTSSNSDVRSSKSRWKKHPVEVLEATKLENENNRVAMDNTTHVDWPFPMIVKETALSFLGIH